MGAIDRTRIGPRPTGASSGAAGDLATHEARRTFPAAGRAGLASFARGGHHGGMRRALPELAIAVSLTAPALAHGQAPAELAPAGVTASEATLAPAAADHAQPQDTGATPQPAGAPAQPETATPPPSATPAVPAPVASPPLAAPIAPAANVAAEISPPRPRLQLSAGLVLGPHAVGEADCQSGDGYDECQHRGNFLGTGVTIELRAQLFKALYLHVRGVVVGNVRQRPYAVHSGLGGGGIGLGAYSRLAFIRGEYMLIPAFGPSTYVPPFYNKQVGRDDYGLHAGMLSGGLHKYVSSRAAIEGWAGLVVGPSSRRQTISEQASEKRLLISFMINFGVAFDLVLAKGYVPPPWPKRQRRKW